MLIYIDQQTTNKMSSHLGSWSVCSHYFHIWCWTWGKIKFLDRRQTLLSFVHCHLPFFESIDVSMKNEDSRTALKFHRHNRNEPMMYGWPSCTKISPLPSWWLVFPRYEQFVTFPLRRLFFTRLMPFTTAAPISTVATFLSGETIPLNKAGTVSVYFALSDTTWNT